jgi:Na+/H+ antiporter NhaC
MFSAMLLARATGSGWDQIRTSAIQGALHVFPALAILWLARTLGDLCGDRYLHTGDFLSQSLRNLQVPAGAMPVTTFLVASAVSLATGTSWGTMGLITPLAIGITHGLLQSDTGPPPVDHPLLLATIGAVLAGAIFGDHCSPVSDTTILSSRTSMCDHIQHVRTQLPYTFLAAALSCPLLVGVGWGLNPWMMMVLGFASLAGAVRLLGKPVVEPASSEPVAND